MGIRDYWPTYDRAVTVVVNHIAFFGIVGAAIVAAITFWSAYASPLLHMFAPYSYMFVASVTLVVFMQIYGFVSKVKAANLSETEEDFRGFAGVTIEGFRRDIDSLWKNVEALKPLLNSDAKTARIAPLEELEWVTPARAAELFLPEFTQAIARGWGDVNECDQEMQNAADQHRRILSASPGKPLSEELKQAYIQENTRISHAQARRASAMREIDKLLFQRIEELRARLEAGQLLAQGFLMARTIGAPPTNIAKQEWRILDFDTTEADWSAVKTGSSRMYQGVRIAQPKPLQVD